MTPLKFFAAITGIGLFGYAVFVAFWAVSQATASPVPTDVDALCAPYGGVQGGRWTKEVKRSNGRETYSSSADCKDGSWVIRSYDK